ncbi:MAG: hypothetical protein HYV13_02700 [Candidatus Doudnabacteria bacterium]|nr:hypothetical protein [Candidatus Doudnabacteria bacterium]
MTFQHLFAILGGEEGFGWLTAIQRPDMEDGTVHFEWSTDWPVKIVRVRSLTNDSLNLPKGKKFNLFIYGSTVAKRRPWGVVLVKELPVNDDGTNVLKVLQAEVKRQRSLCALCAGDQEFRLHQIAVGVCPERFVPEHLLYQHTIVYLPRNKRVRLDTLLDEAAT